MIIIPKILPHTEQSLSKILCTEGDEKEVISEAADTEKEKNPEVTTANTVPLSKEEVPVSSVAVAEAG